MIRLRNWLRRLWHSGPLSRLITSVLTRKNRRRTLSHHSSSRSTMKSLVIFDRAMYNHRSSCSGRKMPKGVRVVSGLKS